MSLIVDKTVYVEELQKKVTVEVDIEIEDVRDYISDEASPSELYELADNLEDYIDVDPHWEDVENYMINADMKTKKRMISIILDDGGEMNNTLEGEMKEEWWEVVRKKYTLQQLEDLLGNKYQI